VSSKLVQIAGISGATPSAFFADEPASARGRCMRDDTGRISLLLSLLQEITAKCPLTDQPSTEFRGPRVSGAGFLRFACWSAFDSSTSANHPSGDSNSERNLFSARECGSYSIITRSLLRPRTDAT
jgi:hypothetical protein